MGWANFRQFSLFALIFSIALALSANYADALSCSVKASCSGGEAAVLRMQDVLGGHAGIWNSSYPNVLCCSEPGVAIGRDCRALGSDYVLNLSADTDAHVQKNTVILPNYPVAVCLSSTPYRFFDCQYDSNTACSNLGAGYSCVASVSGDTNAHIGNCTAYTTAVTPQPDVCCKVSAPPNISSVADYPDPVESGKNITFDIRCSSGSNCTQINATAPFGLCGINATAGGGGGVCGITTLNCDNSMYTYNVSAENTAGIKAAIEPAGNFTVLKADSCSCFSAAECFGNLCLGSKCVTPSPPAASSDTAAMDIIVPLGTQGQVIVTVKNTLAVEDDVDVSVAGNPQKLHNWLWLDGHRYDDARYKVRLHLAAGEEKAVAVQIFGGEVTAGWSDTPTVRIAAKSSLTGLEAEVSKTVSIMYSDDGLTVQTPEFGWIGVVVIAVVGAMLI